MRKTIRRPDPPGAGFTLIEVLTVIAVVGVLASVAIPAFDEYARRSKTAEVPENLRALYLAAAAYGNESVFHEGPAKGKRPDTGVAWGFSQWVQCRVGSSGRVPATPGADKQYGDFASDPTFEALHFSIPDPVYFSYQIRAKGGKGAPALCKRVVGPAYTLQAVGDLDGDGDRSLYELATGLTEDNELVRAPGLYVEDATE